MSSAQTFPRDPNLLRTIYRAAGWARMALVVHMIVVNCMRLSQVQRPALLVVVCVVVAGWSVIACLLNVRSRWRTSGLMILDMAITLAVVGSSRYILGIDVLRESYLGVACYWMLAAPAVLGRSPFSDSKIKVSDKGLPRAEGSSKNAATASPMSVQIPTAGSKS